MASQKQRVAAELLLVWYNKGVPNLVTGKEAAALSMHHLGFVVPRLLRTQNNGTGRKPINLTYVADEIAEWSGRNGRKILTTK